MRGPAVTISCVSNVFVKQMHFQFAGDREEGHSHLFDHLTLLASGKVRVTALGKVSEFVAPQHIFIKAGVEHELEALEDNTVVHCIHGIREKGCIDIIDPKSLPAYMPVLDEDKYPMVQGMVNEEAANAV